MNVTLPEKEKISKKRIFVYCIAILACITAIVVVVMIQVLGDDTANHIFGIQKLSEKTEEEENILKNNFDTLFNNGLEGDAEQYEISKIENNRDIVYTSYEKEEKVVNSYEVSVHIPYINVEDENIQKYNDEIKKQFQDYTETTLESQNENIIYTVEYQAYIENSILSVIIRSNLKKGASAQRVIVLTYNYDLVEKKELSLEDIIQKVQLNNKDVQEKIRKEIKEEQIKAEELKELGFNIYTRDSQSERYLIENSEEFFVHNGNLYIIYAYGNDGFTSETDLVII